MTDSLQAPNRLIHATSPYLLEHAYNPVDWRPWGNEAFAEARALERPVFLSIGYASCHWCHVMAEESFEDLLIAELLNGHFVPIKVDREQWPDVDSFYMQACVALQGHGGWPLNAFLMPDRRPFYAVSYLPAGNRSGQMGLCGLLSRITGLWESERVRLEEWAEQLTASLACTPQPTKAAPPDARALADRLEEGLFRAQDEEHGGIGGAPKFPNAPALRFLLRRASQTGAPGEGGAFRMAARALEAMARGGIRDHVGHGFFRYAVDRAWRIPHYEKMLQDNALLALAYLEAARGPGAAGFADADFEGVARDALAYITGMLTGEAGGFFSSQDADDPGGEGAYYRWTPEEVQGVLGAQDGVRLCALLGIGVDGGALEAQPGPGPRCDPKTGCSARGGHEEGEGWLPFRTGPLAEPDRAFLEACLPMLARARDQRPAPRVIALCPLLGNGLAIAALATAARELDGPEYLQAAEGAARFVSEQMAREGRLMGSWSGGKAGAPATVDGYAAWIGGLLCLHAASPGGGDWLAMAERWQAAQRMLFTRADGGLTLTGNDLRELPAEQCAIEDGAAPSGAAMTAENLLALHRLTGDAQYRDDYERLLAASLPGVEQELFSGAALLMAATAGQ